MFMLHTSVLRFKINHKNNHKSAQIVYSWIDCQHSWHKTFITQVTSSTIMDYFVPLFYLFYMFFGLWEENGRAEVKLQRTCNALGLPGSWTQDLSLWDDGDKDSLYRNCMWLLMIRNRKWFQMLVKMRCTDFYNHLHVWPDTGIKSSTSQRLKTNNQIWLYV